MKVKLYNIVNSKKVFDTLITTKLDGATAFKLARNIKNINIELTIYEEFRRDLIIKYGEKKSDVITEVLDSKKDDYIKELNELLQQELEINILPIKVEKLNNVSPFDINLIDWMLETDEVI